MGTLCPKPKSPKMELQSVYRELPTLKSGASTVLSVSPVCPTQVGSRDQRLEFGITLKSSSMTGLKGIFREPSLPSKRGAAILCAANSNAEPEPETSAFTGRVNANANVCGSDGMEATPLYGLSHQLVGEERWPSACRNQNKGSFFWVLAPTALILSLILPRLFVAHTTKVPLRDNFLLTVGTSLLTEGPFYIGLAIFLRVTEQIQQLHLQCSSCGWGLITGLTGYLTIAFLVMAFKVIVPLVALRLTWELLDPPARVALISLVVNCVAQLVFERSLYKCGWSCWPLVPIIFEIHRIYQLTETTHHIEALILSKQQRYGSLECLMVNALLVGVIVILRVLAGFCLWSLVTFLMRIVPSKPLA